MEKRSRNGDIPVGSGQFQHVAEDWPGLVKMWMGAGGNERKFGDFRPLCSRLQVSLLRLKEE